MKVLNAIGGVIVGALVTVATGNPMLGFTAGMASYNVMNGVGSALGLISKKKKSQSPAYSFGALQTQCSNLLSRPNVYGNVKAAGNIIYRRLSADSKTCYALVAFADGEISKFSNIRINDFPMKHVTTNKITNGDFEASPLSGWTDGTKISITRDTTNPITGTASGKIAIASGITAGDYVKFPFTIAAGDKSSEHLFSMKFKTIDTASGKNPMVVLKISIHDGTNDIFSTIFTNQGQINAYFATTASANYELRITVLTVNTTDIRTSDYYIDDIVFGKQVDNTVDLPNCSVSQYTGNGTQTIDTRVTGATNAIRAAAAGGLKYDAYLALTIKAGANVSSDFNVTAEIFGKKVRVYSDTTTYTTVYNNNPAWCILDFMTCYNTGWLAFTDLDIQSFIDAAAICDTLVNGRPRYSMNFIIDEKKSRLDWLGELCSFCAAYPTYQQGKTGLLIESTQSVAQSFDSDNIIAGSEEFHALPSEQRYDIVKVQYIDPAQNWAMVYATAEADVWQGDIPNVLEITAYGVTSFEQASRLAWFYLNLSTVCDKFISFKTTQEGLDRTVGDVISITSTFMGYIAKEFRILGMVEAEDGQIQLICREYDADIYADELGSAEPVYDVSSLTPPAPINLVDVDADSFVMTNAAGTGFVSQDADTHRADLAAANVAGDATQTFKVLAGTGANDAVPYGKFVISSSTSGYVTFPNGWMLQWNNLGSHSFSNEYTFSFPTTFPHACLSMIPCGYGKDNDRVVMCATGWSTTQGKCQSCQTFGGSPSAIAWAIGY